jgi:hypothetical protein
MPGAFQKPEAPADFFDFKAASGFWIQVAALLKPPHGGFKIEMAVKYRALEPSRAKLRDKGPFAVRSGAPPGGN